MSEKEVKFKYEIGDIVGNYKIIDRKINYYIKSTYTIRYKTYNLQCLNCGHVVTHPESYVNEEKLNKTRCVGCIMAAKAERFKIGAIIKNQEIIDIIKVQVKSKNKTHWVNKYKLRCLKDGYEHIVGETSLYAEQGCPLCAGQVTVEGVNDIATIAPWMLPLFYNPEDAKGCGPASHKKVIFKCPDCGVLTEPKRISAVYTYKKVNCRACSDGISIPEKFMFNVLYSNNVNFQCQKSFDWSDKRKYDFYLPEQNTIIETHGFQHYKEGYKGDGTWDDYETVHTNDLYKEKLALPHVKNYIIIDCSKSDYNFLLANFKKSLVGIIDITKDYQEEFKKTFTSRVISTKDLWNEQNLSIAQIADQLKMSKKTIREYLKRLEKLNLLTHSYNNPK